MLTTNISWQKEFQAIEGWSFWLAEGEQTEECMILRRNVEKGLPCGTESFIRKLERRVGRNLTFRPQGRPKNDTKE